ncbi:MAG: hypothetical protein IPF53_22725 [Blastocatellia bacterium]|nr:hypothetical protein [Blastocatellia bacterium]
MAGKISDLTAASSVADADQFELLQGGTNKRATAAVVRAGLVYSAVQSANRYLPDRRRSGSRAGRSGLW